jgi:hypothetical protein
VGSALLRPLQVRAGTGSVLQHTLQVGAEVGTGQCTPSYPKGKRGVGSLLRHTLQVREGFGQCAPSHPTGRSRAGQCSPSKAGEGVGNIL